VGGEAGEEEGAVVTAELASLVELGVALAAPIALMESLGPARNASRVDLDVAARIVIGESRRLVRGPRVDWGDFVARVLCAVEEYDRIDARVAAWDHAMSAAVERYLDAESIP